MAKARPSLRWAGRALSGLALVATFVVATVVGMALHLDTSAARRLLGRGASLALSVFPNSRFELSPFDQISFRGLHVAKATVFDPHGHRVLTVSDLRIGFELVPVVKALLSKDDVLAINIRQIRAEKVDAAIVAEPETGVLTIVTAFTPPASPLPAPAASSGRSLRLLLPSIEVGSGTVHAAFTGVPPLDAELSGVQGRVLVSSAGVAVDVTQFETTVRGLGADVRGKGTVSVHEPGAARATFQGAWGDVELGASGQIEAGHAELSAKIPSASPAAVQRFLPELSLAEPVSAELTAQGTLPDLGVHARLALGPALVDVEGRVDVGSKPHAAFRFSGEHVNAHFFSVRVPSTDVAVHGDVELASERGNLSARIKAHADKSAIEGYPVPSIDAEATVGDGTLSGTAEIHEPGMPAQVTFRVGQGGSVDVDARAKAVDLRQVRTVSRRHVAGRGTARLRAHLEGGNLTASLEANTGVVDVASLRISDAQISAQLRGPVASLEKLEGAAHLSVKAVTDGAFTLENVQFDARGNMARATFDARGQPREGPEITLAGTLAPFGTPLLRDTSISVKRDPVVIEGKIAEFDPASARLHIRDIRATGAGGPLTGSAQFDANRVEVEAHGDGIDLDVLARALALPRRMTGGRASVSLRLLAGKNAARAHLRIDADHLTLGTIGPLSTEITADLENERLSGDASVKAKDLGTVGAAWNVTLSGSPLHVASLKEATGIAEVQMNDANLAFFDALLPAESPLAKMEGRGSAKLEFTRATAHAVLPSLKLTALTRGLAVVLRGSGAGAGQRVEGVDFDANVNFDGESGETSVQAELRDARGGLASIAGKIGVDVPRLVSDPELALAALVDAPMDLRATAPSRRISNFPEVLRIPGVDGEFGWETVVRGTLAHPKVDAKIDGRGIVSAGSSSAADVHAEAQYDWSSSVLRGRAEAKVGSEPLATAALDAKVPAASPKDFEGTLRLDLKGLPLDFIGALAKKNVGGRVFGSATVSKLQGKSAINADLRMVDAVIARTPLGEVKLRVTTDGAIVSASATLAGGHSSFNAEGKAGLTWIGPIPSLSPDVPVRGRVIAKGFSLVSGSGAGASSKIGGRVDANFTVAFDPEVDENRRLAWTGRVDGSAVVQDGMAFIDLLGVDVHDISFRVQADGKGKGTHVTVADIKGRVRSTADNVGGSAELDLEGLEIVRAAASIYAKNTPLFIRGAPQGHVSGDVSLRLERKPEHMLLDVDVPTLKLTLPELSSRKVIDVADNPEIVILDSEAPAATSGTAWKIPIHLGHAVSIHRSDVEVNITGSPVVELGTETRMTGSIELVPGGRIPVLGQVFAIGQGLITFDTGAPDNPALDVTAQWRTPDQTFVYVRVTGRMKEVQIALRSDPPRPQREVFALLFGGTTEAVPGSTSGSNSSSAARTAALQGPVSQLNRLLGQSPVELRVGSTSQAKPCYTAAVRVRENLWFEASTFKQSDYSGGTNADQNVVAGTIDYRFSRSWSVRTQAGSLGGALDSCGSTDIEPVAVSHAERPT